MTVAVLGGVARTRRFSWSGGAGIYLALAIVLLGGAIIVGIDGGNLLSQARRPPSVPSPKARYRDGRASIDDGQRQQFGPAGAIA